jgi:hypothetical protein
MNFGIIKTTSNVNSTSNVAHQSNNSANPNSSVSYLNLNNTTSNTNSNISSRLLPVDCDEKSSYVMSKYNVT